MGGGGKGSAPKPDPQIGIASRESIRLGRDQFNWIKNEVTPEQMNLVRRVVDQQLSIGDQSQQRAEQQWTNYLGAYQPVEDRAVLDSLAFTEMSDEDAQKLIGSMTDRYGTVLAQERDQQLADLAKRRQGGIGQTVTENKTNLAADSSIGQWINTGPARLGVGSFGGDSIWLNTRTGQKIIGLSPTSSNAAPFGDGTIIQNGRVVAVNSTPGSSVGAAGQGNNGTTTTTTTTRNVGGLPESYYNTEAKNINNAYTAGLADIKSRANELMAQRGLERQAAETAAGRAGAEVEQQADAERQQLARYLTSTGVDPSSPQYAEAMNRGLTAVAANKAGAMNNARTALYNTDKAARGGIINFGRNMPNTAGSSYATTLNAGNSAVGNFDQAIGTQIAGRSSAVPFFSAGIGGLNNLYNSQINAFNAQNQQGSVFGNILGEAAGFAIPKLPFFT